MYTRHGQRCVHTVYRRIGFWNDSLVGGRCFLSCSFSCSFSCSVRGRKIRGTNARWELVKRRRGSANRVGRVEELSSGELGRESGRKGGRKDSPRESPCVFLRLSWWPRYFPRRSFFPATGKPTDRYSIEKASRKSPASIDDSSLKRSLFQIFGNGSFRCLMLRCAFDPLCSGNIFQLVIRIVFIDWQTLFKINLSENQKRRTENYILYVNNINKPVSLIDIIKLSSFFQSGTFRTSSSFPPSFLESFLEKGQRYFRFLSISLTFTLPRINPPHPRGVGRGRRTVFDRKKIESHRWKEDRLDTISRPTCHSRTSCFYSAREDYVFVYRLVPRIRYLGSECAGINRSLDLFRPWWNLLDHPREKFGHGGEKYSIHCPPSLSSSRSYFNSFPLPEKYNYSA